MPAEHKHRSRIKKRYTIVLLPESEAGKTKRMTMGMVGFLSLGTGVIVLAVLIVLAALIFTPIGVYIPNPELENRYHKQIVSIQDRLTKLTGDLTFLREYNVRLRKALGEALPAEDSAFIASLQENPRPEIGTASILERPQERRNDRVAQPSAEFDGTVRQGLGSFSFTRTVRAAEGELPLTMPVQGYVTQEFQPDQQHFGIDFAGKLGTPVYAAANGTVIFSGWTYEDGYMIMIAHGSGYRTTYKHNQSLLKTAGESVRRGEPIALLGNSGKTSYGPHLHFEVWKDGIPLDPRDVLLPSP